MGLEGFCHVVKPLKTLSDWESLGHGIFPGSLGWCNGDGAGKLRWLRALELHFRARTGF